MLEGRRVVVVVPAFEEADFVGRVVRTMPDFVDRIVVVDDGSRDETSQKAASPRTTVVRHPARRGVGAAIATGYRTAFRLTTHRDDALCVMAGDGQMHPDDLHGVASPIVRGDVDYVKGVRFGAAGVRRTMGTPRWVGGWAFSLLTSVAIGRLVTDSQCGYTALRRGAAARLDLDGLWPGFGYPNDLLGQLAARSLTIREVGVRPVYGDERSKLRLRHLPAIGYLIGRAAVRRAASRVIRTGDTNERDARAADAYHPVESECGRPVPIDPGSRARSAR